MLGRIERTWGAMNRRFWAWPIIALFLLMLSAAIAVNISQGGTFLYRDTFTYDYNGDGVAEERHGATVKAYPLDSPSAYTSMTTDTALTGWNFQLVLDDTYAYYKIKVTGYAPNDALAKTEFQRNTKNFVIKSGDTLDVDGVLIGTTFAASADTVYDLLTANKMRVPDSLTVGTVRSSKTISGRGLTVDSLTVATATTMPGLNVTGTRPRLFAIDPRDKGTVNLRNPKVLSLYFGFGFKWQYLAAETLWMDGLRASFGICLDSVGASSNYMTWNEIRELQNMGHEIWMHGGWASYNNGGKTRWGAYTEAQLDTALLNAKASFTAEGITLSGWRPADGDSASFAKFKTTIAKHFAVGTFNTGWNPADPTSYSGALIDSVHILNLGDTQLISALAQARFLISAESLTAYQTGLNDWPIFVQYGSPSAGNSATDPTIDERRFWRWCDSIGVQIVPIAEIAKQWYRSGWPNDWNPISNGDFRWDLDGDGRPDGWYCVDSSSTPPHTGVTRSMIKQNGPAGPTPEGHRTYAVLEPYVWGPTLRGFFTGFEKDRKYAISFWVRNDCDGLSFDTTSYVRLDIFRRTAANQYVGSDAARWGYIAPTLPADTLWHKIDYTVDPDLIVAMGDSTQQLEFHFYGGQDTVYVTGLEAHLWEGDQSVNYSQTISGRGVSSDSVNLATALVGAKNSKILLPATGILKIPAGAAFPASPDSAWLYQKTGSDNDSLCIYDKTKALWRCF